MKLINNNFGGVREINGFSKEEILEIKRIIAKFKEANAEEEKINDYLNEKFPQSNLLDYYTIYLSHIETFKQEFLNDDQELKNNSLFFIILKVKIINELKITLKNCHNLALNSQNVKRFLKQNSFLDNLASSIQELTEKYSVLISEFEKITPILKKQYENKTSIWIKINRIKNTSFRLVKIPPNILFWEDIKEMNKFINTLERNQNKKKKKKDIPIFNYSDAIQFFTDNYKENLEFYLCLVHLLISHNIIEEIEEEFMNVVDKKEIEKNIKELIQPMINELIKEKLSDIIYEIKELIKQHAIGDDQHPLELNSLLDQKVSIFLPKIIEHYFSGLEKKYQLILNDVNDIEEFKNIIDSYSIKIDILTSIVEDMKKQVQNFENLLKPYDHIIDSLMKIITNVDSEILRRRNEFEYYLKTMKKERLRENIQNFVLEKIRELNIHINKYEDKTSLIIREEFPQLKQMRMILNDYKEKISTIKDEVFKKLDMFKEKDVDLYSIIKKWEDNFLNKRQQLSFLLSLMLNKIFKNFKTLIEEEEFLFDSISEISKDTPELNEIPLNFALSDVLADKMTIDELKERTSELQAKINKNETLTELYRQELKKIEDILGTRIKAKEGIVDSTVKCTVCHQFIKFGTDNIIKCPFCDSTYHYLCVAFWLSKYNSCPTCQNVFLDPNSELFDVQEEQ